MKLSMDEIKEEYQQKVAEKRERISVLIEQDLQDEDGYPTEAALEIIELWPAEDEKAWFDFIHGLWHLSSWGWDEGESIDEVDNSKGYCYYISTAGWSGNESIIRAMQKNWLLWHVTWVQSRRGGHYIFQLRYFE